MSRAINEADCSQKLGFASALFALGLRCIAIWGRAVRALVKSCVGIPHFDRNSSTELFAVSTSPHTGDGLNQCGLTMIHMPGSADIDLRLLGDLTLRLGRLQLHGFDNCS